MSLLTERLELQMKAVGLPEWEAEYIFHPVRKWRADYAWPDRKIIVECDGGIWSGGRHVTGAGYMADCEKRNAAVELGWRYFNYCVNHVDSGHAIEQLERMMKDDPVKKMRKAGAA